MIRPILCSLVLTFLLLSSISLSAQVTFAGLTTLNAGGDVYEVAKGDFNNDGKPDLITANYTAALNKQVTLLLNTGSGTFTGTSLKNFAASDRSIDVAVGDFNEDGKLDAVVCSDQADNFSLLVGDGAGNLAAPLNFAVGSGPHGIAVADMNKDNHLDVLLTHIGTPDDVHIYFGNGANGFSAPLIIPIVTNLGYDIAAADFNGDTNMDFAVIALPNTGASSVQIWNGNGLASPTFTLTTTVTGFGLTPDIDARDVDGDGDMDLLGVPGYAINDGTGSFAPAIGFVQSDEEYAVGDLNNDGHPDIAATDHNQNGAHTRIYLGDGAGAFTLLAKFETFCYARGLEILDVNNDGNLDVVGAGNNSGVGKIDILLGDGTGYFSNAVTQYPVLTDPRDMVKGDFNEDGKIDIALCHSTGVNNVTIYLGLGNGKFSKTAVNYTIGPFPFQIITMDYNEDDHLDLVTFNQSATPTVTLLTGDGNGQFTPGADIAVTNTTLGRIATADYNNDTHPDLIVTGGTSALLNLMAGNGTGLNAPITIPFTQGIHEIKAADLTGDGKIDLAARLYPANKFMLLTGDGAGSFTEGPQYDVTRSLIELYDLNNDSKLDVVFYTGGAAGNDILINDGTGNFTASTFNGQLALSGMDYADMNGDGSKDLLVGSQASNSSSAGFFTVFRGTPSGVFGLSLIIKMFSGGNKLVVHDVNGDGKPDVITTSFNIYEDYLAVLINTTGTVACTPPSISSSTPSTSVCGGQTLSLSVTASGTSPFTYQWKKGAAVLAGETASSLTFDAVIASDAGSYSVTVTNGCGNITSPAIVVTVTTGCSNQPPVITDTPLSTGVEGIVTIDLFTLISDTDDNLDVNSLNIAQFPQSGAEAFINNGILTIDYSGTSFTGTDHLTIEICDLSGSCAQQQLTIEVSGDLLVYNAFSPNGDPFNATWQIKNIELLEATRENKVSVYNRWGDEVFSATDYDNSTRVFKGISKGGGELPSGTYFYTIEFMGGRPALKGYLVLKR